MRNSFYIYIVFVVFTAASILSCATTSSGEAQDNSPDIHNMVINKNSSELSALLNEELNLNTLDETGWTPLHYAVKEQDIDITKTLLSNGADPNIADNNGLTPLYLSIIQQNTTILNLLLKYNGDPLIDTGMHENGITLAFPRNIEIVKNLVNEENVNLIDIDGDSLLHIAVGRGYYNVCEYLLSIGANVNALNDQGKIPLDIALDHPYEMNYAELARLLIKNDSRQSSHPDFFYIYKIFLSENIMTRFEYGRTGLHYASEFNHIGFLRLFMATPNGIDINIQDNTGNTPLHIAAWKGNSLAASELIKNGADVNRNNSFKNTPLHESMKTKDNLDMVFYLLKNGADINAKNNHGNTPLHIAALSGIKSETIEALLMNGSKIGYRNKAGNTALMEALQKENKEVVLLLLKYNADPFASNNRDENPVKLALSKSLSVIEWFFTPEMIQMMDNSGKTALHYAVEMDLELEKVKFLLSEKADPNYRNFYGDTPFHVAVEKKNLPVSHLFLNNDADPFLKNNRGFSPLSAAMDQKEEFFSNFLPTAFVNIQNRMGESPLTLAIKEDYFNIVKILIEEKNADIEIRNIKGQTPLFIAIETENKELVEYLLSNGANVNSVDNFGNTPIFTIANLRDPIGMGNLLLSKDINLETRNTDGKTILHEAVISGNSFLIKFLLDNGARINSIDNFGKTPLFYAISEEYLDIVSYLINQGSFLEYRDQEGNTVLHEAILLGKNIIAQYLIDSGADIYAGNKRGKTPLDLAILLGPDVIDWFFNKDNIYIADNNGNTPLHIAVLQNASANVMELLIEKGADKYARNSEGKRAYDLAVEMGYSNAAKILKP